MAPDVSATRGRSTTGLRRFLNLEQQRAWMEGKAKLRDGGERAESLELRLKYVGRYEKLLRRPQAREVLEILGRYGRDCIPVPLMTERHYWSVSCLPSTPGKALIRVNASWMELFALYADGEGIRANFLVHLSDFTGDHSLDQGRVDDAFLERCVEAPEDVGCFFPRGQDIFGVKVRGYRLDRQVHEDAPRVARHQGVQPDAYESGPERLSGEPLLQPGGSHAGGLSVSRRFPRLRAAAAAQAAALFRAGAGAANSPANCWRTVWISSSWSG